MKEKIIKELPIFWTFLKKNGVTTIHQVKFRGFYTDAIVSGQKYKVHLAVFNIAGRSELFIGWGSEYGIKNVEDCLLRVPNGNTKLFNLEYVFPTKELAEEIAKSDIYGRRIYDDSKKAFKFTNSNEYEILPNNPLYGKCEWWWGNNTPSNMKAHICKDGNTKLCGWYWDGLKAKFVSANMDEDIEVVDGIVYRNYGRWPVYDMVTCDWVGNFDQQYFFTKEECEEKNATKVFVFED